MIKASDTSLETGRLVFITDSGTTVSDKLRSVSPAFVAPLIEVAGQVTVGVAEALGITAFGLGASVSYQSQQEALEKLTAKKTKLEEEADGRRVLTGLEAIQCVEKFFNEGKALPTFMSAFFSTLASGFGVGAAEDIGDIAVQEIAECFRLKYLGQTKKEVFVFDRHRTRNP